MTTPTLIQFAQTRAVAEEIFLGTERQITGDKFEFVRGFVGNWEVLETTRKIDAIYQSGTPL